MTFETNYSGTYWIPSVKEVVAEAKRQGKSWTEQRAKKFLDNADTSEALMDAQYDANSKKESKELGVVELRELIKGAK